MQKTKINKTVALVTLTSLYALGVSSISAAEITSPGGQVTAEGKHTYNQGNLYVQEDFVFSTSARVTLSASESSASMGVGTVHNDGQYSYAGSTDSVMSTCGDKFEPGQSSMASFDSTGCTGS